VLSEYDQSGVYLSNVTGVQKNVASQNIPCMLVRLVECIIIALYIVVGR